MHDPQAVVGHSLNGKYQVRRLIGRGGMGAVYEGLNVEIGKRVAIKTIDQFHAMSGELTTRLKREARATAAVESSHIVQVFDVGEDPQFGVYMVMEFLAGEDLGAKLLREGRLDTQTAVTISMQVARALVKAHGAGIVHRDLKPGNVFLTEKEEGGLQVKVVDFGISKILRDDALGETGQPITRFGTALGTPQYMSPEQAQGNTNIDHRTDIWALGCLLYEMLAGKPPYEDAPTYEMTIVRILTTRPQPLAVFAPWVPPALAQVVDGMLVHEWELRMPDAQTFLRLVSEAMQLDPAFTGRYSTVSAPARVTTGFALDKTMPASADQEAMIAQVRAQASLSNVAVSVDEAPAAGLPRRRGLLIPLIALGVLVCGLGVGGWALFGREPETKTPAAKPVEAPIPSSEPKAKSDKTEPAGKPEDDKPEPPPSASVAKPAISAKPKIPGAASPSSKIKPGAPPSTVASTPSGKSTGPGFGGAGVSENY